MNIHSLLWKDLSGSQRDWDQVFNLDVVVLSRFFSLPGTLPLPPSPGKAFSAPPDCAVPPLPEFQKPLLGKHLCAVDAFIPSS